MFSVIMPTYNCAKYVAEAVQSVLAQTYSDFELIIVDDGSTDGTFELLYEISEKDDRIKLYQIAHAGVSVARNYGIEKAVGDKILFMDGDDSWKSNLLECCLQKNDFELLLFGIQADWYDKGVFSYSETSMESSLPISEVIIKNEITTLFSKYNMASPCNKVYKRSIINECCIRFSAECVYLEDLKFNIDYLKHIRTLCIINKDLYKYRLHIGQNQILKRNFQGVFLNANALFMSTEKLLATISSSFSEQPLIVSILLKAYYEEFCCKIFGMDRKNTYKVLKQLNTNKYYRILLRNVKGKFFFVLKLLIQFKCYPLQIKIIKRRYAL